MNSDSGLLFWATLYIVPDMIFGACGLLERLFLMVVDVVEIWRINCEDRPTNLKPDINLHWSRYFV